MCSLSPMSLSLDVCSLNPTTISSTNTPPTSLAPGPLLRVESATAEGVVVPAGDWEERRGEIWHFVSRNIHSRNGDKLRFFIEICYATFGFEGGWSKMRA